MLKLGKGTEGSKDSPSKNRSDVFLKQNYGNNMQCQYVSEPTGRSENRGTGMCCC